MKNHGWIALATLVALALIYSLGAFAYMHATFTTKYELEFIRESLSRIETELGTL